MQRKLIERFSSCDSGNDLQQLFFILMEDFISSKYIIISNHPTFNILKNITYSTSQIKILKTVLNFNTTAAVCSNNASLIKCSCQTGGRGGLEPITSAWTFYLVYQVFSSQLSKTKMLSEQLSQATTTSFSVELLASWAAKV